jgi:long-chain acyl-CoA synthetase
MLGLDRISSVGEALSDAMVTFKSNVALIEAERHRENGRWTYADVRRIAEGFAARLQSCGVAAGDRVAIIMQNQARWPISATGAIWAGATLVPIDYKAVASDWAALLRHARPAVLVTEYVHWEALRAADREAAPPHVFVVDAPDGAQLDGAQRWDDTPPEQPFAPVTRTRADIACIVYSSGTAGAPKGCMLTHGNYLAQAHSLSEVFPFDERCVYFSVLPTNHAIDFMAGYLLPFLVGATVVHQRTLRPQYLGPTMQRYGVTHMSLVPTILKNLKKRLEERLDELPSWQRSMLDGLVRANEWITLREPRPRLSRMLLKPIHDQFGGKLEVIFAGGAFVERDTVEFFYRHGLPVAVGYGLTEAGTVVTVNDLKPFRAETVGRPVPGTEVEVRDANEAGVGEVWVRGPTVMAGYLDDAEATKEAIADGWLNTGDLGTLDASGHLRLVGRRKNMIVTEGGKNIYPEAVEAAFADLAGAEEICVFAADYLWPRGSMIGEELVVAIRPKSGADVGALATDVQARNRRLEDFKRVSGWIRYDEEFPRTASLKIRRNLLAERLRGRTREASITPLES